jgi:hypothetical protein
MLVLSTFVYDCILGPVCRSLVSESPLLTLYKRTVVLARTAYNVVRTLNNINTPRMISSTACGWPGKSGFFFAGSVCSVWSGCSSVFGSRRAGRLPKSASCMNDVSLRRNSGTLHDPFEGMVEEQAGSITTRESEIRRHKALDLDLLWGGLDYLRA